MNQFDKITATIKPQKTDNLVDGMQEFIGRSFEFQAMWTIERAPFIGEWAMSPTSTQGFPFGWIPLCDLTDIRTN